MPVCSDMIRTMSLPLFFFLSGCFFKTSDGLGIFLVRQTNKILIPFFFWFISTSLLLPLIFTRFGLLFFSEVHNVKTVLIGFIHGKFPNSAIWFLLCLFWVNVMFYVISIIASKFKNLLVIIIILCILTGLIGVMLGAFSIRIPLFIDTAFTSLPFFSFGYLMYRYSPIVKPNKYDKYIPVILLFLFLLMYFFLPHYSLKFNLGVNFRSGLFIFIYICGFAGALSVVLLSKWIKKILFFNYWGQYSLMILVSHWIVYRLVGYALDFCGLNTIWCCVINLLVTMGICSLLIPLFIRFLPHVTAQKGVF